MDLFFVVCFIVIASTKAEYDNFSDVQWTRTAQNTNDRLTKQAPMQFKADDFFTNISITIDRSKTFQTIFGFGGAFTDSTAYVFSKLNSTLQDQFLRMYFSEDGLRYNMGRLPIGSCDFSTEHYNYDNVKGDVNLTHFSIAHDTVHIIPLIKKAMETKGDSIFIIASPWSPPAWMKKNGLYNCITCLMCDLKNEYQQAWADYISKFITAYSDQGISIWGITVQNEPGACPLVYEGMHFSAETEKEYIKKFLGPTMFKDHPEVNILIYDHNKDHVVKWAQTIYSDDEASKYVWGTAVHWYSGDQFDHLNTTHYLYPKKSILATEATVQREKNPKAPLWSHGEKYAHDIIGDMNNWVVGFIDWNLLLDIYGGPVHAGPQECEGLLKCGSDGMIIADLEEQVLYPQVFYYYVGHFSKFVSRDSLRISNTVFNTTDLECIAFLSPAKEVIVVVMNTGDQEVIFKLLDIHIGGSQAVKVTALPHSIQSFIYT